MFGFLIDTQKESLIKENAELRKELTEIRQRQLLIELMRPYREQQQTVGLGVGIWMNEQK